jgi:CHAT domain-containing protein/tetratricopeptide (TPR) repeat protein
MRRFFAKWGLIVAVHGLGIPSAHSQNPLDLLRGAIEKIGSSAAWNDHIQAGDAAIKRREYAAASSSYEAALRALEKSKSEDERLPATLEKLAVAYGWQERIADVDAVRKRLVEVAERVFGPDDLNLAYYLYQYGSAIRFQYRFDESIALFKRSLDIRQRQLGEHTTVTVTMRDIALTYEWQGRYADAESMYLRAVAMNEKIQGPWGQLLATSLNELASLFTTQGRYAEAEPLLRRTLQIRERGFGVEHETVAYALHDLAMLYILEGRYAEAEAPLIRALAINPDVGWGNITLASLYLKQGRRAEADAQIQRAIASNEKYLTQDSDSAATALSVLGDFFRDQSRYAEAEPLYKRSLVLREKFLDPDHPRVGQSLNDLAVAYSALGRRAEAEPMYMRSLKIRGKALGPEHPEVAQVLSNLAALYRAQGKTEAALQMARRSSAILAGRFGRDDSAPGQSALSEQRTRSGGFEQHVALLASHAAEKPEERRSASAESFEIAQLARASDTAAQVARMAARHAAGTQGPARLARERQDAVARLERLNGEILSAATRPPQERDMPRERWLREEEAGTRRAIAALDASIEREFPQYRELTSPRPLPLEAARKLLGEEEALVVMLASEQESFLWALRRGEAQFIRLAVGRKALDDMVRRLRRQLDLGAADLSPILAEPFDAALAHELYQATLGKAEPMLAGVRHLIFVPDGALQSLPPGVLVTEPPKGAPRSLRDPANTGSARNLGLAPAAPASSGSPAPAAGTAIALTEIAWLVRKYAITVLPAVSALRALRQFAKAPGSSEPFGGFGDPTLEGSGAGARGVSLAKIYSRGGVADVTELRKLQPLPESADELRAISAALKAPQGSLRLRDAATETAVKEADLARYRNVAFATHALMAGEFRGFAEPALVLTPPAQASELDDGLLTASEISQLKLDADWVVLSACNTAAADGTPGAEGFSGLARAFFFAGARSLLVSHWSVSSDAAVGLTTRMFVEYAGGARKADALRRSMLALMETKDKPNFSHPAFWAPFVVVGEGNTAWTAN